MSSSLCPCPATAHVVYRRLEVRKAQRVVVGTVLDDPHFLEAEHIEGLAIRVELLEAFSPVVSLGKK